MTVYIFLDDVRLPPSNDWQVARTTEKAYALFQKAYRENEEIVLSLDHDLGDQEPTGYDLLNKIERDIVLYGHRPNVVFAIHSANPVGRGNMERAIKAIERNLIDPTN